MCNVRWRRMVHRQALLLSAMAALVEAVDAAGTPVPGVRISVDVDPEIVSLNPGQTNAAGTVEFRVPAGRASLSARKDAFSGSAVLDVASGETKPVRITMEAR